MRNIHRRRGEVEKLNSSKCSNFEPERARFGSSHSVEPLCTACRRGRKGCHAPRLTQITAD